MICPYSSFIFCPCLAFWIVPILKKLSSGFTFEVLIILICRKGCDRICLSAKQGRWCPQPLRAMCFYNKSKWKKKKKGSFAFNIINRNPTKYYLNHYAHTVAALLVLSAVFFRFSYHIWQKKIPHLFCCFSYIPQMLPPFSTFTDLCKSTKLNYFVKLYLNRVNNLKFTALSDFIIKWYFGTSMWSRVM